MGFGNVSLLLAFILNCVDDHIDKFLALLPARNRHVFHLCLCNIYILILKAPVLFLENLALEFDWFAHVHNDCLCILRLLEDFVGRHHVVLFFKECIDL